MVRVRIAPSPTGDPHVGTAYIALFNSIFARQNNGKFILRIEDTDQERSSRESENAIYESLRWLGIRWDEGPDVGGSHSPYRQSERLQIYREKALYLIENGYAYYCFCTPERLKNLREKQRQMKQDPRYDRHCLNLSSQQIREKLEAKEPHVIRLKIPSENETVVKDRIRGEVRFENRLIDDQILIKSDGFPTYHLANVVDDHLMGVTHVIRAEEWLSSMPKHIALYRAFGWNLPEFCHMPLLRNRDKTKISKRKNPVSLTFYRNIGILPEALLNFLGLMGFSLPDDKEVFSVDEMVEHFSFDKIKLGGPVFDFDKLLWLNGIYIRKLEDKELTQRLIKEIFSPQRIDPIIPLLKERIKVLGEFPKAADFFFNHRVLPDRDDLQKALKGMDAGKVRTLLKKYVEQANEITIWKKDEIEKHLKNFCEKEQVSSSEFFMLLRILVTGGKASPPLIESIEVIGRTALTRRVLEGIILIGAGGV